MPIPLQPGSLVRRRRGPRLQGQVSARPPQRTFYVSPTGSDSNNGLSPGAAWQTVSHVNGQSFLPGDSILFQGGQTFSGTQLFLTSPGSESWPITVGSYGTGNATLTSGTSNAVFISNAGGYVVTNLTVGGITGSTGFSGIQFFCSGTGKLPGIQVLNCAVTGWQYGINVGAQNSTDGYNAITISGCDASSCVYNGVIIFGPTFNSASPSYSHSNLTVTNTTANGNTGLATVTTQATGFGMAIGSVSGGLISYCTAHGNGASNKCTTAGPVGIMVYASTGVTMSNCVAYGNSTGTATDGDGLDIDVDCNNCTVEYCLSYGNAGSGILCFGASDGYWGSVAGNTVRYNLCWGNGTNGASNSNYHGELTIAGNGAMSGVQAYGNTLVAQTAGSAQPSAVSLPTSNTLTGCAVRDNIIYTASTGKALTALTAYAASSLIFQGNCYWSTGTFGISYGGTTYTTLAAWRAAVSGQEVFSAANTGLVSDPQLFSPGTQPPVTSPFSVTGAAVLSPGSTVSPVLGAGLPMLADFSIYPGGQDYFGIALPAAPPVGAIVTPSLVNSGIASGTGAAQPATAVVTAFAGLASGTGAAPGPAVATVAASTSLASGAGAALQPSVTVTALAGLATGTGTAQAPVPAAVVPAGLAHATGAALQPASSVTAAAGLATGTGTAQQPAAAITVFAGLATGTGAALQPLPSVTVLAGLATGTGSALQPAVQTSGNTTANAGLATGAGSALSPAVAITVPAGLATGTGTAQPPTAAVTGSAGLAAGAGSALQPVPAVTVFAGLATGTGAALQPTVQTSGNTTANAGLATGTAAGQAPVPAVTANAGLATGTGAALNGQRIVPAGLAAASGAAQAPSLTVLAQAAAAHALAAALNAAIPAQHVPARSVSSVTDLRDGSPSVALAAASASSAIAAAASASSAIAAAASASSAIAAATSASSVS